MKYFKKLVGDKIYLSPRNIEDAELYVKWMNDFDVTDFTGRTSQIMDIEGEKEYLSSASKKTNTFSFAIVKQENDRLIGSAGLEKIDYINRVATLGIMIGEQENREKGYGTETINLLLDFGFNYLNLNNINLYVMEFNPRAIACYKKCGFKEMGRRRKTVFLNGKYYDKLYMDILKEEFDERGKTYIKNKNIK